MLVLVLSGGLPRSCESERKRHDEVWSDLTMSDHLGKVSESGTDHENEREEEDLQLPSDAVPYNMFACACFSDLSWVIGNLYVAPFPSSSPVCNVNNLAEVSFRQLVTADSQLIKNRQKAVTNFDMVMNYIWLNKERKQTKFCQAFPVRGRTGDKRQETSIPVPPVLRRHRTNVWIKDGVNLNVNKDFRYACGCQEKAPAQGAAQGQYFFYGDPEFERKVQTWGSSAHARQDAHGNYYVPNGCLDECENMCKSVKSEKVGCFLAVGWRDSDKGGAPKPDMMDIIEEEDEEVLTDEVSNNKVEDDNMGEPLKDNTWKKNFAEWFAAWAQRLYNRTVADAEQKLQDQNYAFPAPGKPKGSEGE